MEFTPTEVDGCWIIDLQPFTDERGFFARTFDPTEMAAHGIDTAVAQTSIAVNDRAGTLRGMHLQIEPHAEGKLVRCTRGTIVDACIDLRGESPTFRRSVLVELSAENRRALWIPPYCAHGYLTLTDDTEVSYQMSGPYAPAAARGVRYDDPALGLEWPAEVTVINERDRNWPDWDGTPLR
ncbi:MAG: dTDP-4-dehydrorhamnose 3,5-epimerase family protein [Propionibacteriaceae bacterium]|nr:dTDP-4-dehydrorhamnose 3,5-epimerase family protein [Propionibacteriaceae bacterium]